MKWTNQRPIDPGFYWYRFPFYTAGAEHMSDPMVVMVTAFADGKVRYYGAAGEGEEMGTPTLGEWAGPLPMPDGEPTPRRISAAEQKAHSETPAAAQTPPTQTSAPAPVPTCDAPICSPEQTLGLIALYGMQVRPTFTHRWRAGRWKGCTVDPTAQSFCEEGTEWEALTIEEAVRLCAHGVVTGGTAPAYDLLEGLRPPPPQTPRDDC